VLARCPSCRNTFSTDHSGRQVCPVCQKPLIVPEPAPLPQAEIVDAPAGTPWERRGELGFGSAWFRTVQQALLEPGKLFASARLDRGPAQLGFAVLTASAASIVGQLLGRLLSGNQSAFLEEMLSRVPPESALLPLLRAAVHSRDTGRFALLLALTPLFSALFLYLNAAVTHGVAVLIGQSKRGFPATFAACAYSSAPLVLSAVPACGGTIGVVWLVVLTGIGMKIVHGISPTGAVASVLLPYGACCCLFTAVSMLGIAMGAR
jgi:hypothetical protein